MRKKRIALSLFLLPLQITGFFIVCIIQVMLLRIFFISGFIAFTGQNILGCLSYIQKKVHVHFTQGHSRSNFVHLCTISYAATKRKFTTVPLIWQQFIPALCWCKWLHMVKGSEESVTAFGFWASMMMYLTIFPQQFTKEEMSNIRDSAMQVSNWKFMFRILYSKKAICSVQYKRNYIHTTLKGWLLYDTVPFYFLWVCLSAQSWVYVGKTSSH